MFCLDRINRQVWTGLYNPNQVHCDDAGCDGQLVTEENIYGMYILKVCLLQEWRPEAYEPGTSLNYVAKYVEMKTRGNCSMDRR